LKTRILSPFNVHSPGATRSRFDSDRTNLDAVDHVQAEDRSRASPG
jgi:hypothetical protein